ncbi:MAG: ABC transporter permease [Pseudomonadota bacterium]
MNGTLTNKVEAIGLSVTQVGTKIVSVCSVFGGVGLLSAQSIKLLFSTKLAFRELMRQLYYIGNKSFGIVGLIAFFTGLVFALQLGVGLGRFGLKIYIGQIVGLAIFRELAPVLSCVMIAARVGSGIAAEIGSMVVTEQVLAVEAMGANPVQKLVVPRMLATTIAAPILTIMADIIGVVGGMIISMQEAGVTAQFYFDQIRNTVLLDDFYSGIIKSVFFGFFIAIIACYEGLNTRGGTEGVGRVTTRSVVRSCILIFVSDFFLTKLVLVIL